LAASTIYASVVLQKFMIEVMALDKKVDREDFLKECIAIIENRYSGVMRDKLLTLLLVGKGKEGLRLMSQLFGKINNEPYKTVIGKMLMLNRRGRDFSHYALKDMEGKDVSLSSFNDKVVLLDFWFTGCTGCMRLNKSLVPVYEAYKKDPRVAIVSISIDSDLDQWKKSVKTGKYSSPYGVHLYTGTLGTTHPIITENSIAVYPKFYILKNGGIYSAIAPIPKGPDDTLGIQKLSDLIEKAIQE
jgi:thiol-disulfide isomerase/thioredoxin